MGKLERCASMLDRGAAKGMRLRFRGGFWTECLDMLFVCFDVRAANEVDAVGDCREDSVEAFGDGFGFTGQVEDQ